MRSYRRLVIGLLFMVGFVVAGASALFGLAILNQTNTTAVLSYGIWDYTTFDLTADLEGASSPVSWSTTNVPAHVAASFNSGANTSATLTLRQLDNGPNAGTYTMYVIAMKVGSCSMSIAKRSNGVVVKTVSTKVAASATAGADVVALDQPTVVYFANGTSKLTASSKTKISTLAPSARSASAVFVGGFSGNTSKDKANQIRLAQGRAVNTRAALRDAGVGATITIWSYGRTGAVTSGKTEAEQNLNRRAVIYVVP